MISIYDFTDYRKYLNSWIDHQSSQIKGIKGRLAEAAGVSSSLISLILKGDKHLSLEQALEISEFLGLNDSENDYFFLLVEYGKAGSVKLKRRLQKKIDEQKKKISNRISKTTELNDEVRGRFYSSWLYSGIRNLSALPDQDIQSIAKHLDMKPNVIAEVLDFLTSHGLCKIEKGKLTYGPSRTHLSPNSPFIVKHHQNWRLKGMQLMEKRHSENTFFTSPMSLSERVASEVQNHLLKTIEEIMAKVGPSDSEEVRCLNIDWFKY